MIPLKERLTIAERAYLAGLFDGEGTIGYYNYRDRHEATAMITNTDPRIMNWILDKIGYGNVCTISNAYHRRKHAISHWRITNKPRMVDFLEAITPYLIIKRDQAELLLKLWNDEGINKARIKITPDIQVRRNSTIDELKLLKTKHLEVVH